MGRKPEKTRFPDRWHVIGLRVKGRLKNQIIDYARQKKISVNELILFSVYEFIINAIKVPKTAVNAVKKFKNNAFVFENPP